MSASPDTAVFFSALSIPKWLQQKVEAMQDVRLPTLEERLAFVHGLAEQNVREGTGSPFGAAVFDAQTHQLLGVGVNQVVQSGQSSAHAEMLAIAAVQHRFHRRQLPACELVSSCEPCAMCTGGFLWSNIQTLVYGEPGTTACTIGFDEGDKPADWAALLRQRGRQILGPFPSEAGKIPFALYKAAHGKIY